jgi:Carbohydrate family 9 binding domain-like
MENQKMILTAEFCDTDFIPDGNLDKEVWATARQVRICRDAFRGIEYPEIETVVASVWTNEYLYLAYWCKYESLNLFPPEECCTEGSELWTRDVVEAFVAPVETARMHYYELEVSPDNRSLELENSQEGGRIHNAAWKSGFEHASTINYAQQIWTVEMRIPLQSMKVQRIVPGVDWRINLYRADGFGNDEQRRLLSWAPLLIANYSFHQPESFGILRFVTPRS